MAPSLSRRPAPQAGIMCPLPGHLGHLYQGAWVGVVIAPTMLGHPLNPQKMLEHPSPAPSWGYRHCKASPSCSLRYCNRRGLDGEAVLGTRTPHTT